MASKLEKLVDTVLVWAGTCLIAAILVAWEIRARRWRITQRDDADQRTVL